MRFEMTQEAQKILDFLDTKPREFTYQELQNLTGLNDLVRLRGYLMTALRRQRKKGVWYASIRGVGYRLLAENEKNVKQAVGLDRVKRHVVRLDKDQDTIAVDVLDNDGKMAFSFNAARIGRLREAASRKTQREIQRKISNGDLPLPGKKK